MTYSEYCKECLQNNVEPTKEDFLGIELSWEQIDTKLARCVLRQQRKPKTMSATVGR